MKRLFTLLLALPLVLGLSAPALADVIWEPENDFYAAHSDECTYVNRSYILNGQEGYVELFRAPGQSAAADRLPNGAVLQVSFVYPGESPAWALVEYARDGDGGVRNAYGGGSSTGWIAMDSLVVQYDSQSFQEEHAGELRPYQDGPLEDLPAEGTVLAWAFPGSADSYELTLDPDYMEHPDFDLLYPGPDGRLWGHCVYYMGNRDFWICISEPTETDLPVTEIHYDLISAADPADIPAPSLLARPMVLAGILVAAVVAVTLLLLVRYRRKSAASS